MRTAEEWYTGQGGKGIPPMVHYLVLSNLAWLKKPASASKLKLHELIALCVAALRPTRAAWQAFLRHFKRLQKSGQINSDEVAALVASKFTDEALLDEDISVP